MWWMCLLFMAWAYWSDGGERRARGQEVRGWKRSRLCVHNH